MLSSALALLAQADPAPLPSPLAPVSTLFNSVVGIFSQPDALANPDNIVQQLSALGVVWAIVFIIVGVLCLFNGYKYYKLATIGVALVLGLFAGYWLGERIDAPMIVAACLGLLMAVIAFPLMKFAVALFGGMAGAFAGANLWSGLAHAINQGSTAKIPVNAYWLGALIGLIVCGMLAFVLFKLAVELFTSVSGSTIAVLGVIALLLSFEPVRAPLTKSLTANQLVIPLLVFVPAVIGLILQETWSKGQGQGGGEGKPA